jgi:hypothetical protein
VNEQRPGLAPTSVACSLTATDLAQRRERWLRLGESACVAHLTTDHGLRLVFRAAPGIERQLSELAGLERACGAFATWSVHDHGDEVALDVSARARKGSPQSRRCSAPSARVLEPE